MMSFITREYCSKSYVPFFFFLSRTLVSFCLKHAQASFFSLSFTFISLTVLTSQASYSVVLSSIWICLFFSRHDSDTLLKLNVSDTTWLVTLLHWHSSPCLGSDAMPSLSFVELPSSPVYTLTPNTKLMPQGPHLLTLWDSDTCTRQTPGTAAPPLYSEPLCSSPPQTSVCFPLLHLLMLGCDCSGWKEMRNMSGKGRWEMWLIFWILFQNVSKDFK